MATAPVGSLASVSELASRNEINDAPSVETLVRLVPRTRLVILSCDEEVIEMVREAAHSVSRVAGARDLDHLLESLPGSDPDVLIIDGANNPIAATIERLQRHFPEAVTIIIGSREESDELMQMAAVGRIFRFLLRPLSSGPVRLALAAAVSRCAERKGAGQSSATAAASPAPKKKSWVTLTALAAALLVMIGGVWAAAAGFLTPQTKQAPVPVVQAPVPPPVVEQAPNAQQQQLAQAETALSQGRLNEPGGALDQYRAVLAADPGNAAALAGIRSVGDELLNMAEQSLLNEKLEDAQDAIALVREIDAEHPRLPFLGTQVARERERRNLREQRVERLVSEARADMQAGNLLGWVSGGAVDALLEARKLDPRNDDVTKSIRELTSALADAVRRSAAAGDTQRARAYTTAAIRLGVSRQTLASMERALTESRQRDNAGMAGGAEDGGP